MLVGIQQRYVTELVTEADPSVQAVTAGMRRIVAEYKKDLADERRTVEAIYKIDMAFISGAFPGERLSRDRLLAVLAEDHFAAKAVEYNARAAKLDELDKALVKIATGHAELRRNVNDLSSREFAIALKAIAQDLQAAKGPIDKLK